MGAATSLRCRQIGEADLAGIADLLTRGFPRRPRGYWAAALDTLRRRPVPDSYPRYGFMLDAGGTPVGVLLMICQTIAHDGPPFVRCNLASWYVEPAFRSHAAMLSTVPLRYRAATFLNTSPAPNTLPIIEAQGFLRFAAGQVVAFPLLARGGRDVRVDPFRSENRDHAALEDAQLLADHQASGCVCLVGVGSEAAGRPFVFLPSRVRQGRFPFPGAQLVFCRALEDVVRFARPLGAALARRGRPALIIAADGPVEGLPGFYVRGRGPKFVKGTHRPRPGDLAYTEFPLLGA